MVCLFHIDQKIRTKVQEKNDISKYQLKQKVPAVSNATKPQ